MSVRCKLKVFDVMHLDPAKPKEIFFQVVPDDATAPAEKLTTEHVPDVLRVSIDNQAVLDGLQVGDEFHMTLEKA